MLSLKILKNVHKRVFRFTVLLFSQYFNIFYPTDIICTQYVVFLSMIGLQTEIR